MPIVKKVERNDNFQKLKKVAAYTRVSCDKDAMLHSLSSQVSYFSELIQKNPEWIYVGVYSDEGLTGTKANRPGFQKMIEDAKSGKIDLILTKSISRFARNTITLLETIRELKAIDVGVYFEEQNINTLTSEGEFLITVLGSYSQEESRSCSENCLWRVKRNFEQGILYGGNDCLGYKIVDKKLVLVPEEAKLVKRIFDLYISGLGAVEICHLFDKEGIKPKFADKWNRVTIIKILDNVNYTGDLLLQKTFRKDHISKSHMKNRGEKDMYLVSNDHEVIIDKETFDKVQKIKKERAKRFKIDLLQDAPFNPFKGKIKCAICGSTYVRKKNTKGVIWVCSTYSAKGKNGCASKIVPQGALDKGMTSEDVSALEYIKVMPDNKLIIKIKDKKEKEVLWSHESRSKSWTKEMREMVSQREKERSKNV